MSNHKEIQDKLKLSDSPQNNWLSLFRIVKIAKDKKRAYLKRQLNEVHNLGFSFVMKYIIEITNEIGQSVS